MNRDCLIYLTSELELNLIELELDSKFKNDDIELILLKNSDYDSSRQSEYPDGFLYFRYILEVNILNEDIEMLKIVSIVNNILDFLWENNISAIASCDYENLLKNNGGYKNISIPWPS
ncbi:hypothetical protein INQ45_11685 [Flavobacterium columnare]|uniref:hypothetical protein n=1 Tax=Flavobacterium columnare TaxID=996 RepID=UPI002D20026B|nr:hypothetical protein [Flavobacterium columnare]MEB3801645.1 hypothetical protein [Flavobacterium columnare]MEB3801692.1 hypothetical protein [Flavobacterium columnare]